MKTEYGVERYCEKSKENRKKLTYSLVWWNSFVNNKSQGVTYALLINIHDGNCSVMFNTADLFIG